MTTDFTSTIASTKKTAASSEKLSSAFKAEFKSADSSTAFDSLLSNASKSYVDTGAKTSSNNFNSRDYAKNTKTTKETQNSYSDASKNTNAFSEQKNNAINDKKIQNKNKIEKSENHNVEKNNTQDNVKNNDDDKKITDNHQEKDINKQIQDLAQSSQKNETPIQTEIQEPVKDETNIDTEDIAKPAENDETAVQNVDKNIETASGSVNTLANEKIIANIEYINETIQEVVQKTNETTDNAPEPETKAVDNTKANATIEAKGEKMNEIGQELIERVLENFKKNENSEKAITSTVLKDILPDNDDALKQVLKTQDKPVQNVITQTASNNEIEAASDQTQKVNPDTNTAVKTAKENLAADTSRFTVNIENAQQENPDDTSILTPTSKTETNVAKNQIPEPVIKVTDEAAAQSKSNVEIPINKDFTASVKDKAAAQMTDLQGTSTVVTEVQNSSKNQSQSNTGQNNASMQGNAAEQVVKLSLDNSSSGISGSESFLNKLDTQMGTSAKSAPQNTLLNKSDIMSQLNAKFNEMQLSSQNKVSIILQPENLGRVSVEIMSSKEGIVAKMTTENQQVKELFDKNVEALKSTLSSQGVNVNNIKVECTNESSNNSMNFEREQFNQDNQSTFSDSNGNNHQTHNSEQNAQSVYSKDYVASEDAAEEEINSSVEIKNTDTKIKHNGKVDYTV